MAKKQEVKVSSTVAFWTSQIEEYEKDFAPWETRVKSIKKRFKDDREKKSAKDSKFNILWSNVQTLQPALYIKAPVPNISRRFEDDDDLGLVTSRILERSTSYYLDSYTFDAIMSQAVLDRLLGGRGSVWVRYVPVFSETPVQESEDEGIEADQELYSEDVELDYIHFTDFGHTCARTWEEVRAVWRKVYLDRTELVKRFGDKIGNKIPLNSEEDKDKEQQSNVQKACIYEIWDKRKKKAMWFNKDMAEMLDERDDPLKLKNFFPCPKSIYATLSNDDLIPTPDFVLYQDQAIELDNLTGRIDKLTEALRVSGVYDKSAEGVQRLLTEASDGKLIPVDNFALLAEKGGLQNVISWFPMEQVVKVLISLYEARDKVKADIYEISGISDIIRGASNPHETATAQQIKGQYASLRLDHMQKDVARFACELVQITAEIIAEHFSIDTIKKIAGIKLLTNQEKQQVQLAMQAQQPVPEEIADLAEQPSWEDVEEVLRDEMSRCFKINIEIDSTIKADQKAEQEARIGFLTAAGSFLQQAATVQVPELQPLLIEMLMFGVRGFRVGRDIEATMKTALNKIKKKAQNPEQAKPDPKVEADKAKMQVEMQKIQAEIGRAQAELQLKTQEAQNSVAMDREKLQLERDRLQMDIEAKKAELQLKAQEMQMRGQEFNTKLGMDSVKMDHDIMKAKLDAKSKVSPELAMSDPDFNDGNKITPMAQMIEQLAITLQQGLLQLAQIQNEGNERVIEAVNRPRKVKVKRDKNNRMTEAVSE